MAGILKNEFGNPAVSPDIGADSLREQIAQANLQLAEQQKMEQQAQARLQDVQRQIAELPQQAPPQLGQPQQAVSEAEALAAIPLDQQPIAVPDLEIENLPGDDLPKSLKQKIGVALRESLENGKIKDYQTFLSIASPEAAAVFGTHVDKMAKSASLTHPPSRARLGALARAALEEPEFRNNPAAFNKLNKAIKSVYPGAPDSYDPGFLEAATVVGNMKPPKKGKGGKGLAQTVLADPENPFTQQAVKTQKEPLTKPTRNQVQKSILALNKTKDLLATAKANYQTEFLTAPGKVKQFMLKGIDSVAPLKEATEGSITESLVKNGTKIIAAMVNDPSLSENDINSARESIQSARNFVANIEQVFNTYRKEITGAQAGFQELQKLQKSIINVNLSPEEFDGNMREFEKTLDRTAEAHQRTLQEGLSIGSSEYMERSDEIYRELKAKEVQQKAVNQERVSLLKKAGLPDNVEQARALMKQANPGVADDVIDNELSSVYGFDIGKEEDLETTGL